MRGSKIFYVRFTSVPTIYVRQTHRKNRLRSKDRSRFFLCVLSQNGVCQGFRGLFVGLFDDVGVDICGSRGSGVTQAFGDGDDISPAVDQHCGDRVPERVGVNVGQTVPL